MVFDKKKDKKEIMIKFKTEDKISFFNFLIKGYFPKSFVPDNFAVVEAEDGYLDKLFKEICNNENILNFDDGGNKVLNKSLRNLYEILHGKKLSSDSDASKKTSSDQELENLFHYEDYSIGRFGNKMRNFRFTSFYLYILLSYELANAIDDIYDLIKEHSCLAYFRRGNNEKIDGFNKLSDLEKLKNYLKYKTNIEEFGFDKTDILSDSKIILKTDITQFYPSIYTHSIAWALHDKKTAKDNRKCNRKKGLLGNRLDLIICAMQDKETRGVPIGSVAFRLIAEIISVAIDKELKKYKYTRITDDYFFGFQSESEAKSCLLSFEKSLKGFHLYKNNEKTLILPSKELHETDWIFQINLAFDKISANTNHQKFSSFCSQIFTLYDTYHKYNVLAYALKTLRKREFNNKKVNQLYFYFLKRVIAEQPSLLPVAFEIFDKTNGNLAYYISDFCSFLLDKIKNHNIHQDIHTGELSWIFLFFIKMKKDNKIKDTVLDAIKTEIENKDNKDNKDNKKTNYKNYVKKIRVLYH